MNNKDIIVSIRCLAYNHEPYIRQCLDGFVMQKTDFRFEAIVHDDASTDGTDKIIREYANKYPDVIKPIFEKENQYSKHDGSLGRIMQEACTGKYIAMCEGDDYWIDPLKLQKQVDFMEKHEDVGLCYTDFNLYDQNNNRFTMSVFENGVYQRPVNFEEHLVGCGYIAPMSWLYRKSVIDELDYKSFTDGTFAQALAFYKQSKVFYLPMVTCVYRAHSGSMSRPDTPNQFFKQYKGVFDTQLYFAEKYQVDERIVCAVKSGAYVKLLPSAIESKNEQFVDEAISYFESQGVDYKELLKLCNLYIQAKKDSRNARKSLAYRIGRTVLKPVNLLRRMKK